MSEDSGSELRGLQAYRDELEAVLAARRELGRDSEEVVIAEFLRRVERALDARIDARIDSRIAARLDDAQAPGRRSGRDSRGGRQVAQIGTAAASLAFGIPLSAVAGQYGGLVGLAVVWTVILLINVVSILKS